MFFHRKKRNERTYIGQAALNGPLQDPIEGEIFILSCL
jgi:hypothetical protein